MKRNVDFVHKEAKKLRQRAILSARILNKENLFSEKWTYISINRPSRGLNECHVDLNIHALTPGHDQLWNCT